MLELTQEYLREKFEYRDGHLYFKWTSWNNQRKPGDRAGSKNNNGYVHVQIGKYKYKVHRIVFLMHHGYLPKLIDHIDGDKANNKIENLREATKAQNVLNSKLSKASTSGVKGLLWHKRQRKWNARLNIYGKKTHIGSFTSEQFELGKEAVEFAREFFLGEFANHGDGCVMALQEQEQRS